LLLKVNYGKENYHIGDLDKMMKLITEIPHENIRDTADYKLEISELVKKLAAERAQSRISRFAWTTEFGSAKKGPISQLRIGNGYRHRNKANCVLRSRCRRE